MAAPKRNKRIDIPDLPSQVGLGPKPKKPRTSALAAAAAGSDPFAQISPAAITGAVNQLTGMYGSPLSESDITSRTNSMISPIVDAVTQSANQRAAAAENQIRGLTDSYVKQVGAMDFAAPYQQAEGQQAAVDDALRQSLTGAGSDLASGLSDRLKALQGTSGQAAVDQAAAGLASQGAASGNTALANGSASLGNLIANAAAAGSYGQKLPGIARLSGLQQIGQAEGNAQQEISQGVLAAEQQLPSIIQNLMQSNQALRGNRASAASDLFTTLLGQNLSRATAKEGLKPQPDASLSNLYGYPVDQYGNPVGGKVTPLPGYEPNPTPGGSPVIPVPKPTSPKKKTGGLTRHEILEYQGKAASIAGDSKHGYTVGTGANQQQMPPVSYQQALERMRRAGIPLRIAKQELARVGYVSPSVAARQQKIADAGVFESPFQALIGGR